VTFLADGEGVACSGIGVFDMEGSLGVVVPVELFPEPPSSLSSEGRWKF